MSEQQPLPAEGPDDPAYTGESDEQDQRDDEPNDSSDGEAQVSEVANLVAEGVAPVSPEDATAGAPDAESGEVQEGTAGPDAAPAANVESNEYDKS